MQKFNNMAQVGLKGSKRCLQAYLEDDEKRKDLEDKVCAINTEWEVTELVWLGPKKSDSGWDWKELTGNAFWRAIGVNPKETRTFWPARGPHWDAVAKLTLDDNTHRYVFFEAKANVDELKSWMRSKSKNSINIIEKSLNKYVTNATTCYYQTSNRIAHKRFLDEIRGTDYAVLCYLIFHDDKTHKPTTKSQWGPALKIEHDAFNLDEEQASMLFNEIYLDASWITNKRNGSDE